MTHRSQRHPHLLHLFCLFLLVLLPATPGIRAAEGPVGAWSAVRYHVAVDGARLLVRMTSTIQSDTDAWTPLPLGNLTLQSAQIDGRPAILRAGASGPEALAPAGTHQWQATATLPMERSPLGRAGRWRVGVSGPVDAPGLRCEGGLLSGTDVVVVAGSEVVVSRTSPDLAAESGGLWQAEGRAVILFGRGVVEAAITLDLKSIGAPPDRLTLTLPAGLKTIEVEGAELLEDSPLTIRPFNEHGQVIIRAEGRFDGEEFDLAGLALAGAHRGEMRFEIVAHEGCEAFVESSDGVTADGATWRVVKRPYRLLVRARAVESREPVLALVKNVRMATTLLPDGRRYGEMEAIIEGRPPRFLTLQLPEGATLLSVVVGETAIAPTRVGGSLLVPLTELTGGGIVRVVYSEDGRPFRILERYQEAMPIIDLPLEEVTWEAMIPKGTAILGLFGPWQRARERLTPLRAFDKVVNGLFRLWDEIPAILWFLIKAVFWILLAIAGVILASRFLKWAATVNVTGSLVGGCLVIFLIVIIVAAVFVALGGPLKNMFANAVGEGTMGENQAALSAGIYGGPADELYLDAVVPEAAPASTRVERAVIQPPPPAAAGHRLGAVSIDVRIPRDGRRHLFANASPGRAAPLDLLLLKKWPWRFLLLLCGLLAAALARSRPLAIPPVIVSAALIDMLLPGAFAAGLIGIIVIVTARLAQSRWRARRAASRR